ncbi:MAG TPA: methionyl-tRNA formyltransferase, partial [Rhizobiaceae bacterium]|nr:methionyl-tRNA formyltransferase [Rhizobiaceae bacterium]
MAGDTETGMMIMKMDVGLDTGPVALTERVPIGQDMTAGELHDLLMLVGARLMVQALRLLETGELTLTDQPEEGAIYARKIDKSETRVDWRLPAATLHDRIRGLSPAPGAWCEVEIAGRMERLKLLRSTLAEGAGAAGELLDDRLTVACGSGAVRLVEVQRAGGKPASAAEFQRGAKLASGARLA